MRDTRNITIAVLLCSAAVLAGLLTISLTADQARADAPSKGRDYLLLTAHATAEVEMLYMIDRGNRRLNVYRIDSRRRTLELVDTMDLERAFTAGD